MKKPMWSRRAAVASVVGSRDRPAVKSEATTRSAAADYRMDAANGTP